MASVSPVLAPCRPSLTISLGVQVGRRHVRRLGLLGGLVIANVACAASPDKNARVGIVAPDPDSFPPVSAFLDHRCGSLDCHGQVGRDLRILGHEGLRLDRADVPGGSPTTTQEIRANYDSVVGLEPEVMSAVVEEGGGRPERLTLVRKGRGTDHHKGGALVMVGDAQDRCLTSWLAGALDGDACAAAVTTP
jgi:hypothetical protein